MESIMIEMIKHIQPRIGMRLSTRLYPNSFTVPQLDDATKLRGPQLVMVWLGVILGSWGLAGLLVYGGFRLIDQL
jgi:hypothetical protein